MSYIDKILAPGEQVVYRTSISRITYLPAVSGAIILSMALVLPLGTFEPYKDFLLGGSFLYMLCTFISSYITRHCTELAVTNRRVIAKFGFIGRRSFEISRNKIESIEIDQPILGRIFNFGTVIIKGTGSGHVPIPTIDDPLAFQRAVGGSDYS